MNSLLNTLVYANFVEAMREFGRWQKLSQLIEREGLLFVAGSTTFPIFMNSVIRLDADLPAPEVIDKARAFFQTLNRDFTILTYGKQDRDLEAAARSAEMKQVFDSPEMVLEKKVESPMLPANVKIRLATKEEEILDVCHINSEAYAPIGFPKEQTEAIFSVPQRLLSPKLIIYVAYLDDRPASTAMAIMTEQVAGIYWVGTIPSARGLGLAEACTRLVSNDGLDRGAQVAALQASAMGERIYQRIGYRTIDRVKCYLASTK
ncbi:MAG: hypothetical protein QNJ54_04265 [Prochloraceae cyanobacterium]|nr:hypothetical protein [Prochloraceae cyanobacterium]